MDEAGFDLARYAAEIERRRRVRTCFTIAFGSIFKTGLGSRRKVAIWVFHRHFASASRANHSIDPLEHFQV
jgi:hypothetical protein